MNVIPIEMQEKPGSVREEEETAFKIRRKELSDDLRYGRGFDNYSCSEENQSCSHSKDRGLVLIDLGSSHGTTLNGKRLESFDLVSISNRCEIKFGLSTRVYSVEFTKGAKEKLRQEMYARLADNRDARVSRDSKRDSEDADNVVFVNNLPGDTTEMQLRKLFERSGM